MFTYVCATRVNNEEENLRVEDEHTPDMLQKGQI